MWEKGFLKIERTTTNKTKLQKRITSLRAELLISEKLHSEDDLGWRGS